MTVSSAEVKLESARGKEEGLVRNRCEAERMRRRLEW